MGVHLQVRREKTNIFLEVSESDSVLDVKQILQGILKQPVSELSLYHCSNGHQENPKLMPDATKLVDLGITSTSAKAQAPAELGLTVSGETLTITPYSLPPPLPDIMKSAPKNEDESAK